MSRAYFRKVQILGSISPLPSTLVFEFTVGKNDRVDMSKSFFVLKDTFTLSNNSLINNASYRVWNHPACLFRTVREKINNATICVTNNYAQTDSLVKRNLYSKQFLDTTGTLMGLSDNASRDATAKAFKTVDTVFVPSAFALWNLENDSYLQPGTNVRLELDTAPELSTCVVTATAFSNYKYNVDNFDLYLYTEENVQSFPENGSATYKMREYKTELYPFNASSVSQNVMVEPSVDEFVYTFQDAGSKPSIFDGKDSALSNHYLNFNNQNYPLSQHNFVVTTNGEDSGRRLALYMNLLQNDLIDNVAGYEGTAIQSVYGQLYLNDLEKDASVVASQAQVNCSFKTVQNTQLVTMSSNTFDLVVNYDAYGNISGMPVKTIL